MCQLEVRWGMQLKGGHIGMLSEGIGVDSYGVTTTGRSVAHAAGSWVSSCLSRMCFSAVSIISTRWVSNEPMYAIGTEDWTVLCLSCEVGERFEQNENCLRKICMEGKSCVKFSTRSTHTMSLMSKEQKQDALVKLSCLSLFHQRYLSESGTFCLWYTYCEICFYCQFSTNWQQNIITVSRPAFRGHFGVSRSLWRHSDILISLWRHNTVLSPSDRDHVTSQANVWYWPQIGPMLANQHRPDVQPAPNVWLENPDTQMVPGMRRYLVWDKISAKSRRMWNAVWRLTFIIRMIVLRAIIVMMKYSKGADTTRLHIRYFTESLFFGIYRHNGRALIAKSIHCFCKKKEKHIIQQHSFMIMIRW